jgi:hypothetical protein
MDNFALTGHNDVVAGAGLPMGGIQSFDDWDAFAKATQVTGYQTDHANLTGTQAIRMESLEMSLRKITDNDKGFKLFKALKRTAVTSSVHEFMTQNDIGGQPDGMFNSELGTIVSDSPDWQRKIVKIKYMMTMAAISHVAMQQKSAVPLKAEANRSALLRLARSVNRQLYYGDESITPLAFDGIIKQLKGHNSGSNIIDMQGSGDVDILVDTIYQAHAQSLSVGNFGDLTHIMMDTTVQNELDRDLDPNYRVALESNPNSIQRGAPVTAIKTSYGLLQTEQDIYIDHADNQLAAPYYAYNRVSDGAPGAPTVAIAINAPTVAGSRWATGQNGTYYYVVCAVDARGIESPLSASVNAAVAVNGALTLTITPNADQKQTGYVIYRSTKTPGAAPAATDYRRVTRIAANAGSATTPFQDLNTEIPGSSTLFLLNRVPESIAWLQLFPATQFPLYPTNAAIVPWAVLLYGALQLGIPNHHFVLKNFLPSRAKWKPFG